MLDLKNQLQPKIDLNRAYKVPGNKTVFPRDRFYLLRDHVPCLVKTEIKQGQCITIDLVSYFETYQTRQINTLSIKRRLW